jgi:hypothetical protein
MTHLHINTSLLYEFIEFEELDIYSCCQLEIHLTKKLY